MIKVHNIVIVGAGPADLYLSAYLSQNNIKYLLIEQAPITSSALGFGILVQDSLLNCLSKININIDDLNIPLINKFDIYYDAGNKVADINLDIPVYSTKRETLVKKIREKVNTENILYGNSVIDIIKNKNSYIIKLSDNKEIKSEYIIGADGIKSIVRSKFFYKKIVEVAYSGIYTWLKKESHHKMIGLYGKDTSILHWPVDKNESVALVITKSKIDISRPVQDIFNTLLKDENNKIKELSRHFNFDKPQLITLIRRIKQFKFIKNNIALIGDAAHGETPMLGWGTTVAVEDAYVLANQIINNNENISKAFKSYYSIRRERVKHLHTLTSLEENLFGINAKITIFRKPFFTLCKPINSFAYNKLRGLYRRVHNYNIDLC